MAYAKKLSQGKVERFTGGADDGMRLSDVDRGRTNEKDGDCTLELGDVVAVFVSEGRTDKILEDLSVSSFTT